MTNSFSDIYPEELSASMESGRSSRRNISVYLILGNTNIGGIEFPATFIAQRTSRVFLFRQDAPNCTY